MKEYVKPTLEAVELRLEERVACCVKPIQRKRGHGGRGGHGGHGGYPDRNECCHSAS